MDLSNLKPAKGSINKTVKESVEDKVQVKVVLLQEVTKELNLDLVPP